LSRPRVLLADDHVPLLEAASALLRSEFEVIGTARDGAALVAEALRLNPDVIVADIMMPGVNGIEAVRQIRESGSSAKLVFLTVHTETEFVNECVGVGATGYVVKSRMKSHLIPAIRAALAGAVYIYRSDTAASVSK
jgi:DNA-binding NarL/FixJ family response regulator